MIAFTICSNNYLDKARILAESIKNKQDCEVYLFLADLMHSSIDYFSLGFDQVIVPEQLGIKNLQWQLENYNIIEFNTSIKGPAFKFLFENTNEDILYYFDPDIKVYQPLEKFNKYWAGNSILLTPHILSPIPLDGLFPGENLFLNHGIYNLGFLALRRASESDDFLKWWNDRLAEKCHIDLKEGYFTDQLWINLVPLLFKNVNIILHAGFNAAYWNLHERNIQFVDGTIKVNGSEDLFFYHFSGFDERLENIVSITNTRYDFTDREEIKKLHIDYLEDIHKYSAIDYKSLKYYNSKYPLVKKSQTWNSVLRKIINKALKKTS